MLNISELPCNPYLLLHYCSVQDLFARLMVLMHDPFAREQLATQILTVSFYDYSVHLATDLIMNYNKQSEQASYIKVSIIQYLCTLNE